MNRGNKITLIFSIFIAAGLSFFASKFPDGLDSVAEKFGFADRAISIFSGLMPDYAMPGIKNVVLANGLAGLIGTLTVFVLILSLGKILFYVFNQSAKNN